MGEAQVIAAFGIPGAILGPPPPPYRSPWRDLIVPRWRTGPWNANEVYAAWAEWDESPEGRTEALIARPTPSQPKGQNDG